MEWLLDRDVNGQGIGHRTTNESRTCRGGIGCLGFLFLPYPYALQIRWNPLQGFEESLPPLRTIEPRNLKVCLSRSFLCEDKL